MLLSRKLFNQFFPNFNNISNQQLETMLNSIGIEVESIFKFEKTDNLVVGEIIECSKHPESDKLNLCKVNCGNGLIYDIVCGAKNARKGLKVIVAKLGAQMIDGRVIEKRPIKGIESCGMICGYGELTNRIDHLNQEELDGIVELDQIAVVGDEQPLKYIGLDDEILDLSIPSNRNELNGIIGIGYDLISVYFPEIELDYDLNFFNLKKNEYSITINTPQSFLDKEICNFFGTIHLKNFNANKSSWKIKSFLINSGYKPKNIFVDITNLNTIITGNPSHAYDASKIGKKLKVELNNEPIQFKALNSKEYKVDKNEGIFIRDENKEISLAGMIGFDNTSVSDNTTEVLFELGNFDNLTIRKLNDKSNIKTEAANLCSKKIPLWITLKAFDSLIGLLDKSNAEFCGISFSEFKLNLNSIPFNKEEITTLLGINLSEQEVITMLKNIGFNIKNKEIIIPIYREDIETVSDIVEELVKKIDINNLEEKEIETTGLDFSINTFEDNKTSLETKLLNKGFSLVKTLNLTSYENNLKFNLFNTKDWIKIINPISNIREYFRNNLIEQHIDVVANNSSRKNNMLNIFEIQGLIYDNKWNQHLCVTISKDMFINKINNKKITNDLLLLKSLITDILKDFNLEPSFNKVQNNLEFLLVNNSVEIHVNNKLIGYAGQINPQIAKNKKYISDEPIYFVEIVIDEILRSKIDTNFFVKPEKQYHSINRQVTSNVDLNFSYQEIDKIYKNLVNKDLIENVELVSVYNKENEIAYTHSFDIKQTKEIITQDEINKTLNTVIDELTTANVKINK